MYEYDSPNWSRIYPEYENITRPNVDRFLLWHDWQRTNWKINTDLRSINRMALPTNKFRMLYQRKFPNLHADLINIYKDGNYSILKRTLSEGKRGRLLPVFVSFRLYDLRDRDEYREKTKEYEEQLINMDPEVETTRLFEGVVRYQDGHQSVCMLDTDTLIYDFFETGNTVVWQT